MGRHLPACSHQQWDGGDGGWRWAGDPAFPPWGYLGFAEPLHLGFPGPAGQCALPGGIFLLLTQVQAL